MMLKNNYTSNHIFLTLILVFGSFTGSGAASISGPGTGAEVKTPVSSTGQSEIEWTMGIGLGVFDYRLYPGAKNTNRLLLPVPYFTFRSPRFEIDRGIKSFIYNSETIVIDISADFGLPVASEDTVARSGMPDLDLVLQAGPSLEFLLSDRRRDYFDIRFELPVRVAFALDTGSSKNTGYLFEPRFTFLHRRNSRTGLTQKAVIGVRFATEDFHAYYYDVAPQFATPERSPYKSRAGFGGSLVNYRITYKTEDFVYWTFLRYQSLRGAVFEDSPLVLDKDYYFIGIGFSWIFANSL